MKRTLLALSFVGFLTACLAGFAQTATPAGDAPPPAPAEAPAQVAAPADAAPTPEPAAPATAPSAAAVEATPPAAEGSASVPQQVVANDAASAAAAPAAPAEEAAPAAGGAATEGADQPGTVIPLIVMDDVPLTDAIRNLARQAGLNYMLDPKIPYGQVGQDGKVTPQPSVTIRWENISAEQALNALLANYSLQLVEDPKSKIARVSVKDPAAPPPIFTKIIQLKYAGPSNVVASVQSILSDKRSKVMPDVRTSQLVVIATEQELVSVDELIERLDTQTRQVLIETRLMEVRINPSTKKGVDWTGTMANQRVTFGNGVMDPSRSESTAILPGQAQTTTTTLPGGRQITTTSRDNADVVSTVTSILGGSRGGLSLNTANGFTPNIGFLNADGVSATLSFLNTYSESKVLSAPRTVTLDNEEAKIEVGTLYPIVNTTAGTANTTGGSQITYSNLTVMLKVTPRISANDYVNLKVSPSISRLGPKVGSVVNGVENVVDSFLTRMIDTRVMIPSGNTLVMGGLIQDEVNNGNTKVPFLGDIPVIGYLFRVDSKNRDKGNLVIFITPTIVQDEDFQPTQTSFLKTKLPPKDSLEEDWSAWDSGQPKDWKKKKSGPQDSPAFDDSLLQRSEAAPQSPAFDESLAQRLQPAPAQAAAQVAQ